MIRNITNASARFLGSGPGLAILLGLALAWVVMHLGDRKAVSDRLQEEVQGKQQAFQSNMAFAQGSDNLKFAMSELAQWKDLADNEAMRISSLSDAAHTAEATIVSLRSLDPVKVEGKNIVRLPHEIEALGLQHQIAAFLDGLYGMEGMASVDTLTLTSEDEDDPDMLVAVLEVSWHAPTEPEVSQP